MSLQALQNYTLAMQISFSHAVKKQAKIFLLSFYHPFLIFLHYGCVAYGCFILCNIYFGVFGPPSYGGSYKITVVCLPVRPSVRQCRVFLENGNNCNGRSLKYLKTDSHSFQENSFLPKFWQKVPEMVPKQGLLDFLKNFVISFSWK